MEQTLQPAGQAQNAPKKKAWYKKWWVIVIAVVVVLIVIANMGDDSKSSPTNDQAKEDSAVESETKTAEPEKMTPEVIVASAILAKDYKENEVAADGKYKGKLIEVSGKVTGVDNGTFDNEIIVKLSDGEYDFTGPWCYMKPSEHDKVVNYKKGQAVTLIGTGNSATIGSPMLKDCVIK